MQMLLLEARQAADDIHDAREAEMEIADHIDEIDMHIARASRHANDAEVTRL